ncbi:MAG: hypothetical protein ACRDP8_07765 [Actinopolymorphaceae bacterium]
MTPAVPAKLRDRLDAAKSIRDNNTSPSSAPGAAEATTEKSTPP